METSGIVFFRNSTQKNKKQMKTSTGYNNPSIIWSPWCGIMKTKRYGLTMGTTECCSQP